MNRGNHLLHAKITAIILIVFMFTTAFAVPAPIAYGENTAKEAGEAAVPLKNPTKVINSDETTTTTWDCVSFGEYPQSEVTGDDPVYHILMERPDSDWDENRDITIDGAKYHRMKREHATSSRNPSNDNPGYYYWADDIIYHYFKYEPIIWRVLSVNERDIFLLADKGLDAKDYHVTALLDDITWEICSIRSWLNGYSGDANMWGYNFENENFINRAFTETEQNVINDTDVINDDNPDYGTEGGNTTIDKVYLLSIGEALNTDYGFDNNARDSKSRYTSNSDFARAMGAYIYSDMDGCIGRWWLRSPGNIAHYGTAVRGGGLSFSQNTNDTRAVRPALHLDRSSNLYSYVGTVSSNSVEEAKALQNITGDFSFSKTYGCEPFELGASAQTALTYESSDPDVAEVSPDGIVTVKSGGTARITITARETTEYQKAIKDVTITVAKALQSISCDTESITIYGGGSFDLEASAQTALTYESSAPDVAEVSPEGVVSIKGDGVAVITITAEETAEYHGAVREVTITAKGETKKEQTITCSSSFSKTYGCKPFALGASAQTDLTYKSSAPGIAAVSSDGTVSVKSGGRAVITITAAETAEYKGAAKTVTITAAKASQTVKAGTSFSRIFGCSAFNIGASAKTKLTYKSSNTRIAAVSSTGKVTLKNPGKAIITITARATSCYKSASKKVTISSKLKKPVLTAKAQSGRKIKLSWSKVPGTAGYKIYIYDSGSKKYVHRLTKNFRVKAVTHKGLKAGKIYRYKIKAYRNVSGKKVYSAYSAVKKARAKR